VGKGLKEWEGGDGRFPLVLAYTPDMKSWIITWSRGKNQSTFG